MKRILNHFLLVIALVGVATVTMSFFVASSGDSRVPATQVSGNDSGIPPQLDVLTLTLEVLKNCNGLIYQTPEAKTRIHTLMFILEGFKIGEIPVSTDGLNLSDAQAAILNDLIVMKSRIDKIDDRHLEEKFRHELMKMNSLFRARDITRNDSYFNHILSHFEK